MRLEPQLNRIRAYIEPQDIDRIAQQVDEQGARILWHLWQHRHANLDQLKKISGETSHMKVLIRIREMINPTAKRFLGRPIMVFERSAMDYCTGDHIFHSWWLNEEAASTHREILKKLPPKTDSKSP